MIIIVVVGSGGFIGAALVSHLQSQGREVIGIQRGGTQNMQMSGGVLYVGDFVTVNWEPILRDLQVTHLVFSAGSSSVHASVTDPVKDRINNVETVERLLLACGKLEIPPRVLSFSSAAVYGNPTVLPIGESAPLLPISPYGIHKLEAEKLCHDYANQSKGEVDVLRPFSVFGGSLKSRVFWDIGRQLIKVGHARARGSGLEVRDFLHISDLVEAVHLILFKHHEIESEVQLWNLASGQSFSIRDALSVLSEALGFDPNSVEFDNRQSGIDPLIWEADVSKLIESGFRPSTSLRQGLQNYAVFLRESSSCVN